MNKNNFFVFFSLKLFFFSSIRMFIKNRTKAAVHKLTLKSYKLTTLVTKTCLDCTYKHAWTHKQSCLILHVWCLAPFFMLWSQFCGVVYPIKLWEMRRASVCENKYRAKWTVKAKVLWVYLSQGFGDSFSQCN